MAYLDHWSELLGQVPKLDMFLAQKLINRAWRDIRDSRLWSFLVSETTIDAPDAISSGSVTVTQDSSTVIGDATADAAWAAIGNTELQKRVFRAGLGGPIYRIASYASPNLSLQRNYQESTAAGTVYLIYKCYYPVPATNFIRWISVIDPINGYRLASGRTKAELDFRDPQRSATTQPYVIASYLYDTTVTPNTWLNELYPHPVVRRSYPALYSHRGLDFVDDTDTLPAIIPDEVLMHRAKFYAYEWAAANSSQHAELRDVNWQYLRSQSMANYAKDIEKAKRNDEEIFRQNYVESYLTDRYKLLNFDGSYAQSHAPAYGWYR